MKDAGICLIDGYDNQEWDTKSGKCVFDYIISVYSKIRWFIKICNYEELNKIFRRSEEENCLEEGVSTIQIMLFCMRFNLPMYALDDSENTFRIYHPETRHKHAPAMIFKLSNDHFYPIPEYKKKYILKITSMVDAVSEVFYVKKEEQKKEPLKVEVLEETNFMNVLSDVLNNTKIIPSSITTRNKKITSFNVKDTKYAINQNINLTKEITENMRLEYNGQTLGNLIQVIIENTIKTLSCYNPYVFSLLKQAKKSRTFGGLLDEEYEKGSRVPEMDSIGY